MIDFKILQIFFKIDYIGIVLITISNNFINWNWKDNVKYFKIIIEFGKKHEFEFVENKSIKFQHPISDYYLKLNNLLIYLYYLNELNGFFFK